MSKPKPQRGQRYFSEVIKRDSVLAYETGRQSVTQICSTLKVSQTSVYKWIDKYSTLAPQGIRIVERKDSHAAELARLRAELARAHQTIARQTIRLDYDDVLFERLRDEHGIDVKKTSSASPLSSNCATGAASKTDTP